MTSPSEYEQQPLDGVDLSLPDPSYEEIAVADLPDGPQLPSRDLVDSVKLFGVQQPPAIFRKEDGSLYVGRGSRTIMAAREAGIETIECQVYGPDAWPYYAVYRLAMNTNRSPNPIAELDAILALYSAGESDATIAHATGLDLKTIRKRVDLNNLHLDLKTGLQTNKIALTVAEKVATLDPEQQSALAFIFNAKGKLTMSDVNKLLKGDEEPKHEQVSFMAGVKDWRDQLDKAVSAAISEGVLYDDVVSRIADLYMADQELGVDA